MMMMTQFFQQVPALFPIMTNVNNIWHFSTSFSIIFILNKIPQMSFSNTNSPIYQITQYLDQHYFFVCFKSPNHAPRMFGHFEFRFLEFHLLCSEHMTISVRYLHGYVSIGAMWDFCLELFSGQFKTHQLWSFQTSRGIQTFINEKYFLVHGRGFEVW